MFKRNCQVLNSNFCCKNYSYSILTYFMHLYKTPYYAWILKGWKKAISKLKTSNLEAFFFFFLEKSNLGALFLKVKVKKSSLCLEQKQGNKVCIIINSLSFKPFFEITNILSTEFTTKNFWGGSLECERVLVHVD